MIGLLRKLKPKKKWRWAHGFDDWVWLPTLDCWFHRGINDGHDYYCRGDRMFHVAYGMKKGDIVYHGSYAANWHGGIQTSNFNAALKWLYEAKGKGCKMWSR